jgi:hypothetical protein
MIVNASQVAAHPRQIIRHATQLVRHLSPPIRSAPQTIFHASQADLIVYRGQLSCVAGYFASMPDGLA